MHAATRFDGRKIRLELPSRADVGEFFDRASAESGFLLRLPTGPKLFESLEVEILSSDGFQVTVQARVIQVFDRPTAPPPERYGVAFQLEGWTEERRSELARCLGQGEEGAEGEEEAAAAETETLGTSPAFRIKNLNVSERMRLAVKASRAERAILLRDNSPQVLMGLLSNPRLDAEEMLQIVRSTHATGSILQRVAEDRRWSQNAEIRFAVARHPKTPPPLVLRLLDTLRTPDLQVLAKSSAVRESLRRAALRAYLGRISGR